VTSLQEEVIRVYAEHRVADADTQPVFLELERQQEKDGNPGFGATVNRVKAVAGKLEGTIEGHLPCDQVKMALQVFNTYKKRPGRQKICCELIRHRYAEHWSQDQRDYFEGATEKLLWRDYFLSFTNYNPTAGKVMLVNREHMQLIRAGLLRSIKPPETSNENLLAELLDYELRNAPLEGFFYPDQRGAADVEECLMREARESFVFVQLIQNSMFEKWPNYCLDEFQAACEDQSRKMIFVMSVPLHEFIERQWIDERMHGWHDAIKKPDIVELEPVTTPARAQALLREIKKRVVRPVQEARNELYDNVPE
jgi:hypothetical protein